MHQHGDRHRSHAAGHRGDGRRLLLHGVEVHVAHQSEAPLGGGIVDAVHADVDHGHSVFHHVGRYGVGTSGRGDDDVGLAGVGGDVIGPRVADRDRGVGAILLLEQDVGHGLAHDVAAAHDDDVLARDLHAAALQELLNAMRGAGQEAGLSDHHLADVHRMESVHILVGGDGLDHAVFVDVLGERHLNENAVHRVIVVQLLNQGEEVLLGGIRIEAVLVGFDSQLLAGSGLVPHVDLRGRIFAHQDHRQARCDAIGLELRHLVDHLGLHFLGNLVPIDNLRAHASSSLWFDWRGPSVGHVFRIKLLVNGLRPAPDVDASIGQASHRTAFYMVGTALHADLSEIFLPFQYEIGCPLEAA